MSRLFLAILLPWEIKQTVAEAAEKVKEQMKFSQVNWVDPQQYHITLHFLGEVERETEDRLIQALKTKEYPTPFELKLGVIDVFPNKKAPRIVVAKTNIVSAAFGLYKRTADVCVSLGLNISEKSWEPHITIGRVKVQSEVLKSEEIILPALSFEVVSFVLMESILTPEGSWYEVVEEFLLGSK